MRPQNTVETEPLRDAFAAQGILAVLIWIGTAASYLRKSAEGISK